MEFGLKGTSRLVADVTGSRHSGLGFTVFWLFTAEKLCRVFRGYLLGFFGSCCIQTWALCKLFTYSRYMGTFLLLIFACFMVLLQFGYTYFHTRLFTQMFRAVFCK